MNPSQKASLPPGLELPVLTDVVEELTLPVLSEESSFELPDFDFSSELDEMAMALPADAGAVELDIPVELPLEDVLDSGPAPRQVVEPVVDFSKLPSLDLEVASLDELALDEVLPGVSGGVPSPAVQASSSGVELEDEPFEFVLSPAVAAAASVAGGPSGVTQLHDAGFDIPELTMEWSEPSISAEMEEAGVAVEPPSAVGLPPLADDDTVQVEASAVVAEPWTSAVSALDTMLTDEFVEPAADAMSELATLLEHTSEMIQPEPAVLAVSGSGEDAELPVTKVSSPASGVDTAEGADETVLSGEPDDGGEPAQPESMAVGPEFLSPATTVEQAAPAHPEPSPASAMPVAAGIARMSEEDKARSCSVVDEQALIDSLTQKILPRMKVELSLWLQDALEMQARQMLSGVMHQLKEDYEMLFNETLRESLRQAITEIGRDEREGGV